MNEVKFCKKCNAATKRNGMGDCLPCRYLTSRKRYAATRGKKVRAPVYCRRCKEPTTRNAFEHCLVCQAYRKRMEQREEEEGKQARIEERRQQQKEQNAVQHGRTPDTKDVKDIKKPVQKPTKPAHAPKPKIRPSLDQARSKLQQASQQDHDRRRTN